MQTTYRLNTEELSVAFINSIKSLLPNQEVNIVVSTLPTLNAMPDKAWLSGLTNNPSFDFLTDEAEDIYSLADGVPVSYEK